MLIGDPRWAPHPVELMGSLISRLRQHIEELAGDNIWGLRVGGILITTTLILISGFCGWLLERLALPNSPFPQFLGSTLLVLGMASTIAARSLRGSVLEVLKGLKPPINDISLQSVRKKLSQIVGRDVSMLNKTEILRGAAETASENSIDGVFAPLFWMVIGAALWNISKDLPGPLALGFVYKASSTMDSMIGYQHGRLKWLGTASARLDDLLTWLPCRIVMLTLPLVSQPIKRMPALISAAWFDGSKDSSPNAGISEAIFAYCAEVKMGGENIYKGTSIIKPTLAKNAPEANIDSVKRILKLSLRLEIAWLTVISMVIYYLAISGVQ